MKLNYKVKPGIIRFSMGCTDGGWLYMDNLRISVNLPKGGIQVMPYHCREVLESDGHSVHVPTPDRTPNDAYGVSLTAIRRKPGSSFFPIYIYSDDSPIYDVPDVDWSGIADTRTDRAAFKATAVAGGIAISNPECMPVAITDLSGRTVARTDAEEATQPLQPGIYIVSAGGSATKILVK